MKQRSTAGRHSASPGAPSTVRATGRAAGSGAIRRRLRIGPGLILASVAALAVWRCLRPPLQRAARPPGVSSLASQRGVDSGPLSPPDLDWLLQHRSALALTSEQLQRLGAMDRRWRKDEAGVQAQLLSAGAGLRNSLALRGARSLQQIEAQAQPVETATGALLAARAAEWRQVAPQLTSGQRMRAQSLWDQRLGRR